MLASLSVQQFAIVEHVALDFSNGFTVMTGETGAGKSILIDALDLLLGGRSDASAVREGAGRADLSAQFDVSNNKPAIHWLAEAEFTDQDDPQQLILRRVVDASGKSKAWVNGQSATLSQLKEIGEMLVDIHGQHAHQALLRPQMQRLMLDAHAGLLETTHQVSDLFREIQRLDRALATARDQAKQLLGLREQLQWKIEEIESLRLTAGEWESLSDEQRRLSHAADLLQTSQAALSAIDEEDSSILGQLEKLSQRLSALTDKDARLGPAVEALGSSIIDLQEAAEALRRYLDRTDLDPERLAEVENRVQAIFGTARKLKTKPESLPEILEDARRQWAAATQAADTEQIERDRAALQAQYDQLAAGLTASRKKACKALSTAVNHWFDELAMGGMRFEAVCIARDTAAAHGMEDIEFQLRNHQEAAPYPIHKVASGGELARISLAIAVVTATSSNIPTLIFDEVDSGIGGNVAHTVGKLLRQLGDGRQVLCVTHLPQVAARGHQHLRVAKQSSAKGPPTSHLTPLAAEQRIDEIARMLGDQGTEKTSREHARSLLALG